MLRLTSTTQLLVVKGKFNILILLILLSFNSKINNKVKSIKDTDKALSGTYVWSNEKVDSLVNCALKDNNHIAYAHLSCYFGMSYSENRLFTISIQMANKNNDPLAYYDLYWILINNNSFPNSTQLLDEKSKLFAIYCLLKAHELGYECDYVLEEYFD